MQICSARFLANIIKIGQHLTYLSWKQKGWTFLKHSVVSGNINYLHIFIKLEWGVWNWRICTFLIPISLELQK